MVVVVSVTDGTQRFRFTCPHPHPDGSVVFSFCRIAKHLIVGVNAAREQERCASATTYLCK